VKKKERAIISNNWEKLNGLVLLYFCRLVLRRFLGNSELGYLQS
jgi:hypothetical protein